MLIQNCATKTDLERLRAELKAEMAEFRVEMKTEMAALRAEMHAGFMTNLKWMLGILLPFFTLLMTVFKFL